MRAEFAYEEAQKYLRQRNWLALVAGGLAVTTLFGVGAAATRDRVAGARSCARAKRKRSCLAAKR